MKKVFIIHGWEGHSKKGWFPWLKKELENKGFEVMVPDLPNTAHPQLTEWLPYLQQIIKNPNSETYFVGHSLGCIAILRYLEKLPKNIKVGGAVLVAGFSQPIGLKETENFLNVPINYEKIKNTANHFIVIHSDNDPYVPLKSGKILEKKLGAKLIIQEGMKHFSGDEGLIKLPIVLDILSDM